MARLSDLLVKELQPPPHDVIPRAAWMDVVRQCGELVLAHPVGTRNPSGEIRVAFRFNDDTMEKIRAILIGHSCEPWRVDDSNDPWKTDPDAWKHA